MKNTLIGAGVIGTVLVLGIGLFYINQTLAEKNSLLRQQILLEERKLNASVADREQRSDDTQKQIDAAYYNDIRAECVLQEKKTASDLNSFLNTCRLPSIDDCLASDAGKLFTSGLGEQAIQKCIERKL